MPTKVLMVT